MKGNKEKASQEKTYYQKLNFLAPWSWISNLQKCEKINFCCLNHPVCGMLLWQPKLHTWSVATYFAVWLHTIFFIFFLGKKNKNGNQKHLVSQMNPSIQSAFDQNSSLFFFPFSLVSVTLGHRIISEMVVWEARN